jgi:hypothetical protein
VKPLGHGRARAGAGGNVTLQINLTHDCFEHPLNECTWFSCWFGHLDSTQQENQVNSHNVLVFLVDLENWAPFLLKNHISVEEQQLDNKNEEKYLEMDKSEKGKKTTRIFFFFFKVNLEKGEEEEAA